MSFAEVVLIFCIALLVLGPRDVLRLMRTVMALLSRWRHLWASFCLAVRQDLDHEDRSRYAQKSPHDSSSS